MHRVELDSDRNSTIDVGNVEEVGDEDGSILRADTFLTTVVTVPIEEITARSQQEV